MKRIREVLLNEYIGAIAIGMLLAYAGGAIVSFVVRPLITYLVVPRTQGSMFESSGASFFSLSSFLPALVSVVLYLLMAYLLLYWLYLRPHAEPKDETNGDSEPISSDEPSQR